MRLRGDDPYGIREEQERKKKLIKAPSSPQARKVKDKKQTRQNAKDALYAYHDSQQIHTQQHTLHTKPLPPAQQLQLRFPFQAGQAKEEQLLLQRLLHCSPSHVSAGSFPGTAFPSTSQSTSTTSIPLATASLLRSLMWAAMRRIIESVTKEVEGRISTEESFQTGKAKL